jgi:hypothetical protein
MYRCRPHAPAWAGQDSGPRPGVAGADGVCGYSILEAGSAEEVETILDGHPHLTMPGGSIEVLELIPMNL